MTTYTLNVVIDNRILALHSKDSLCIAKKVCSCFCAPRGAGLT